jgi:glutathione S-transferase
MPHSARDNSTPVLAGRGRRSNDCQAPVRTGKAPTARSLIDRHLADHDYLVGERFTAADAYLFVVTNWAKPTKVDLSEFANLRAFQQRIAARPAVQAAMKAEGLIASDQAA